MVSEAEVELHLRELVRLDHIFLQADNLVSFGVGNLALFDLDHIDLLAFDVFDLLEVFVFGLLMFEQEEQVVRVVVFYFQLADVVLVAFVAVAWTLVELQTVVVLQTVVLLLLGDTLVLQAVVCPVLPVVVYLVQ